MDTKIDQSLLEASSRGEISRRDISARMDPEVSFGANCSAHCLRTGFRCRASRPIRTPKAWSSFAASPSERAVSDEEIHAKLIVPDTGPLITPGGGPRLMPRRATNSLVVKSTKQTRDQLIYFLRNTCGSERLAHSAARGLEMHIVWKLYTGGNFFGLLAKCGETFVKIVSCVKAWNW
jgi:hypothetical protein